VRGGDIEIYSTRGLVATSDPLKHNPAIAVGKTVTKMHGGALHVGVVAGFDTEEHTGELTWRVAHNDGDERSRLQFDRTALHFAQNLKLTCT
jgi:hypothetical protein